jgi:hypothetical protein
MTSLAQVVALGAAAAALVSVLPPDPMKLWQVEPGIDYTDPLYADWD